MRFLGGEVADEDMCGEAVREGEESTGRAYRIEVPGGSGVLGDLRDEPGEHLLHCRVVRPQRFGERFADRRLGDEGQPDPGLGAVFPRSSETSAAA